MTHEAPQVERELLGALLLDEERIARVAELVQASDFEDTRNQATYRAILGLHRRSAVVDFNTVLEELRSLGSADAHSATELVELAREVTSSSRAHHHAKILAERGDQRRALQRLDAARREIESMGAGAGRTYEVLGQLTDDLRGLKGDGVPVGTVHTVCLADVESKPISWLWKGRIARGKVTLLAGDPGLGKSTLAWDIAARVSRGASWPDSSETSPAARVLISSAEDALDDTVRPRLEAAGAKLENIHAIDSVATRSGVRTLDLNGDMRALEQRVERLGDVKLLVIDPLTAFLGNTDSHKNADVRAVLAPLGALAEKYSVAVLAVTHLNKGQSDAIYRVLGSVGFVAAARTVWFVVRDKQQPTRRLMLQGKNNLGDASGVAFRVESAPGPQGTSVPGVAWESDPVTVGLDEALAPVEGGSQTELERAREFLRSELAAGPMPANQVQAGARANAISEKTLNRAKKDLGVVARKGAFAGGWNWALSEEGQLTDPSEVAIFVKDGHLRSAAHENGTVAAFVDPPSLEDGQAPGMAVFGEAIAS